MAEASLAGALLGFIVFHFWSAYEWAKERQHLVHVAIAKTPGEVKMLDTPPIRRTPEPKGDDFDPGYTGVVAIDQ